MRTPSRSPSQLKAADAERARRYRARKRQREQEIAYADHVLGIKETPGVTAPAKADVARVLRDRYLEVIHNLEDEELLNKNYAPGLNVALKAQDIIDKRDKAKTKKGNAELAFAIIAMLGGSPPPLQLDDGNTIEGEATEVDDDGETE